MYFFRSRWPNRSKTRLCGHWHAWIAGSNLARVMDGFRFGGVGVLSGRGLCGGPITRPGESYQSFECTPNVISLKKLASTSKMSRKTSDYARKERIFLLNEIFSFCKRTRIDANKYTRKVYGELSKLEKLCRRKVRPFVSLQKTKKGEFISFHLSFRPRPL
jgi:hypothetical protein